MEPHPTPVQEETPAWEEEAEIEGGIAEERGPTKEEEVEEPKKGKAKPDEEGLEEEQKGGDLEKEGP